MTEPTDLVLTSGDYFEGSLSSSNDRDQIALSIVEGQHYTIEINAYYSRGVSARLLMGGEVLWGQHHGRDFSTWFTFTAEETKIVFLALSGNLFATGPYHISVYDTLNNHSTQSDDILSGSDGRNRIDLQAGDDLYYAGEGGDVVFGDTGNDTIYAGNNDDFSDVVRGGDGNDHIFGEEGRDYLYGEDGNDRIDGGEGNDVLHGDNGLDTINGGAGDDSLVGGSFVDDLKDVLYGGDGNDTLDGGYGNDELRGDAGHDVILGGFGQDTLIGGTGDDALTGSAFSDEIHGGNGSDFINGGFGSDRVNGGAGADRFFHLGINNHGSDWIQDYSATDGDVLVFGNTATSDQFQVNFANTDHAGSADTDEAFIIYRPTGQILWALVDGAAQDEITLRIAGEEFDLLL